MEFFLITIASWVTSIIDKIGYLGVLVLMTIESSFIPFPSEVVILPAAYLAQQGKMNIYLVVIAGIIGSILGALINYYLASTLGRKIIYTLADKRFFKFLLITPEKVNKAEKYFLKYGNISTLIGRLVVGVRQLISIPAGFSKMKLSSFIFYTTLGSSIWVVILAVFGYSFGSNQEQLEKYYSEISWFFVILAVIFIAYLIIKKKK
ncbi:DedA family protein [Patescibacteria group bacterium]|nr:DedA family protein [Patescibacteria group bacterium]MBU1563740.1 DedA family protein [Patescibacteria group bacterium]MBU2068411.1 DedA family protein [Patescibacteria group bacterium]